MEKIIILYGIQSLFLKGNGVGVGGVPRRVGKRGSKPFLPSLETNIPTVYKLPHQICIYISHIKCKQRRLNTIMCARKWAMLLNKKGLYILKSVI